MAKRMEREDAKDSWLYHSIHSTAHQHCLSTGAHPVAKTSLYIEGYVGTEAFPRTKYSQAGILVLLPNLSPPGTEVVKVGTHQLNPASPWRPIDSSSFLKPYPNRINGACIIPSCLNVHSH